MFYYVIPGLGIYGGVKKAFHCADILNAANLPCAVASPEGGRPTWFASSCPTITLAEVERECTASDTVLFSSPADLDFVETLPGRRIVHMQGASTPADAAMMDHDLDYIAHGHHMVETLLAAGRVAPYVPLGIPDAFFHHGETKRPGTIAVMPRKGAAVLDAVRATLGPDEELVLIDGQSEEEVAALLKSCEIFLAISPDEAFGLPPLEAMAAGCCVVGYPGIGGWEFMRHGESAWLVPNGEAGELVRALRHLLDHPELREGLRSRAAEVASYYTIERERDYLLRALGMLEAL